MAVAAIMGLGSGALHAVTGPDHTLSLMPLSTARPTRAFRVGLLWGVGHSIGTLGLALVLFSLLARVELGALASWSERAAGLALLVMGLRGALSGMAQGVRPAPTAGGPLAIGLLHGVTGAAALLLVLPSLTSGSPLHQLVYLLAFSLGSTIAMGALTWGLARLAQHSLPAATQGRLLRGVSWASVFFGASWLAFA